LSINTYTDSADEKAERLKPNVKLKFVNVVPPEGRRSERISGFSGSDPLAGIPVIRGRDIIMRMMIPGILIRFMDPAITGGK
jgi:hypothetical protein